MKEKDILEQCVIGILFSEARGELFHGLTESLFKTQIAKSVFKKLNDLPDSAKSIELALLLDAGFSQEERIYITECIGKHIYVDPGKYGEYFNALRIRDLNETLGKRIVDFHKDRDPDTLDKIRSVVTEIESIRSDTEVVRVSDMLYDYMGTLDKPRPEPEIKCGFKTIDRVLYGLRRGSLLVVAARPSVGKTSFLTTSAIRAIGDGKKCVYFTTEMTRELILSRIVSSVTNVPFFNLERGLVTKEQMDTVACFAPKINEWPLYLIDNSSPTFQQIVKVVRTIHPDVVFIDYIQRCTIPQSETHAQGVTNLLKSFKCVAKDYNCHVMAAAQINREIEHRDDKRPRLSDIKGSGGYEEEGDGVLLLWNPDPADTTKKEAVIAKNRYGPLADIKLNFNNATVRFSEL